MSILRFEFKDGRRHWRLEPVELQELNLLVGVSGAGKTRTLDSLAAVCATGCGHEAGLSDCQWRLDVATPSGRFVWEALTIGSYAAPASPTSGEELEHALAMPPIGPPTFLTEVLSNEQGDVIVSRRRSGIFLHDADKPIRMKDQESVISLLRDEESIAPLYQALGKVHRSREHVWSIAIVPATKIPALDVMG